MNCFQFGMEIFLPMKIRIWSLFPGALTSLYGEAAALPPENVAKFITDTLDSGLGGEVTFSSQWTVGDDTNIWLFNVTSDFDEKYIILIYIDANFDESQIGIYDTTGL